MYNLTVALSPISVGGLRFYKQIEASIESMKELGFSDSQLNEITSLFTDTNLYLVLLTFAVSMFHVSVEKADKILFKCLSFFLFYYRFYLNFSLSKMISTFGKIEKAWSDCHSRLVRLSDSSLNVSYIFCYFSFMEMF